MNKIFRVIWNQATQTWIAVSELSKQRTKASSSTDERQNISKALLAVGVAGTAMLGAPQAVGSDSISVKQNSPLTISKELKIIYDDEGNILGADTDHILDVITTDVNVPQTGEQAGLVTPTNGTSLVNGTTLANAINSSGWRLTTSQSTGNATGTSVELINPNELVTIDAGNNIKITQEGNKISIAADVAAPETTDLTIENGNVTSPSDTDGSKLVNATTVANVINNISWTATIGKDNSDFKNQEGKTEKQIKAGDTVTYIAGKNIRVKQDGANFTFATENDVTFNNVTADNLSVGPVNITNKGIDAGNTQITNVKAGTNGTDAVNLNQLKANKTFIKNGSHTYVQSQSDNNGTTYTISTDGVNVKAAPNSPVKVSADKHIIYDDEGNTIGTETAYTLNVITTDVNVPQTGEQAGLVTPTNGTSLVNGTTLANAINNSGWRLTTSQSTGNATGTSVELINPNELVTIDAGNNIKITQEGNKISIAADVAAPETTDLTIENGNVTSPSDTDGSKLVNATTIANAVNNVSWSVGDNEGNNVSDVKAGNRVNFVNGTGSVSSVTKGNDGVTNVTFNVKTDDTTIKIDNNGNLTINNGTTTVNQNGTATVANSSNATDVATVGDIVNTINNVSWTATIGKDNSDFTNQQGKAEKQIKAGDTVTYIAGKNIRVKQDGANFTFATENDVTFNNVTANNLSVGPVNITNKGIDAGNTQITNVKAGTNGTDAVNLDQLNQTVAGSKTYVNGTDPITVTNSANDDGSTTYTVGVKTTDLTVNNGTITTPANGSSLVNATTVANAVNNVSWSVGDNEGNNVSDVKAGNRVNFVNGNGTTATVSKGQDGVTNVTFNVNSTTLSHNPNGTVATPSEPNSFVNASTVANAINKAGWTATSGAVGTGVVENTTSELINPGETVKFVAGDNIKLVQDGNNFTFSTKADVTFNNVTANNLSVGPVNITKEGVNAGNTNITNVKGHLTNTTNSNKSGDIYGGVENGDISALTDVNDAATLGDVLNSGWNLQGNGQAVDFVRHGDAVNFVDGTGTKVTVTSDDGVTSKVKVDVDTDTISAPVTFNNSTNTTTAVDGDKLVKGGDVANVANGLKSAGLNFQGNDGTNIHKDLGETLTVKGSADDKAAATTTTLSNGRTVSDKNTYVVNKNGALSVTIDENPEFKSITVANGTTSVNLTPTVDTDGTTSLTLNNGSSPVRIKNVAPGKDGTDAVNVDQLKGVANNIHNHVNKVGKDLRAGIAGANAAAGLPQVYIPGKSMVAAAAGHFKGQNAVAVGYSRASDNGKLILKLQGNANSRGDVGGSVGVGYQW